MKVWPISALCEGDWTLLRRRLVILNLQRQFEPVQSVAVIGASGDRSRFGNKAVRAFLHKGYTVYPVNPTESEIEGLPAYASILDVPVRPGVVSVYVRPERLRTLLPAIATRGCEELWLNPGTVSDDVLREAEQLGLKPVQLCSILAVGMSPAEL